MKSSQDPLFLQHLDIGHPITPDVDLVSPATHDWLELHHHHHNHHHLK